jgi:zinc transport system permease protein
MPTPLLAALSADMIHLARFLLIAGPIIGGTCALLSVYVVLRRMALIAEGISHAGFGGIAIAVLVGYYVPSIDNPAARQVITGLFCLGTALLMGYVTRKKRVSEDSAIGIFLVASIALGNLLLSVRANLPFNGRPVPVDVESLLFGSFGSINLTDTLVAAASMLVVFGIVGALYHQFLYTTLDEEMARINGVNTRLVNTLLLLMISLVIVVCAQMVGFLMITALTIIPGATANMLSRKFGGVLLASVLIGTLGTFGAVCISAFTPASRFDPGPIVVLTLFAFFAVVWTVRTFFKPKAIADTTIVPAAPEGPAGAFGHSHSH